MSILVTGFNPFNGEAINPSQEVLKGLPDAICNHKLYKIVLPTEFNNSMELLYQKIDEIAPSIVLCLGQAGNRAGITVERVGININDAPIEDNRGFSPTEEVIYPDGDDGYFSNLPLKGIISKLKNSNIPSSVSNSAGTFVCNHILYALMYKIKKESLSIRGGFIHIPYIPSQVLNKPNSPSMELSTIIKGITLALEETISPSNSNNLKGGELS